MTLTRRSFGALALASAAPAMPMPAIAQGAKVVAKFGGNQFNEHPAMIAMGQACDRIRAESKGDVDVQFFPNYQLGSEPAMQSQLRSGALEMMTCSGLISQTLVPKAGISGMPFAFKDIGQVWAALDGDLGTEIRNDYEKYGIYCFPRSMDNGFRNVTTSTKPINNVADLRDLKIRVPPSPVWVTLFTALGASPTSINLNELYTALQTKVVDAQENPLILINAGKFQEVQKYCSMTGHLWDGVWMTASSRFWKGLPNDARTLIGRVLDEEAVKQRVAADRGNSELQVALTAKGMVFNQPDKEPFRDHLRKGGFFKEWRARYGDASWAVLEKYAGNLT